MLKDSLRPTVLFEWELYRIVIWEPFMTGNFYAQLKATNSNNTSRTLSEPNLPNFGGNFSTSSPSMPTSDPCGSCCICCRAPPTDFTTSEPFRFKKWLLKRYLHMKAWQDKIVEEEKVMNLRSSHLVIFCEKRDQQKINTIFSKLTIPSTSTCFNSKKPWVVEPVLGLPKLPHCPLVLSVSKLPRCHHEVHNTGSASQVPGLLSLSPRTDGLKPAELEVYETIRTCGGNVRMPGICHLLNVAWNKIHHIISSVVITSRAHPSSSNF